MKEALQITISELPSGEARFYDKLSGAVVGRMLNDANPLRSTIYVGPKYAIETQVRDDGYTEICFFESQEDA